MDIRVICNDWLPSGTIILSKDLYELFKQNFDIEKLDRAFLEKIGIKI